MRAVQTLALALQIHGVRWSAANEPMWLAVQLLLPSGVMTHQGEVRTVAVYK